MQLLNNALETYRQQLGGTYQKINQGARPVLEEFIPLANMSINGPVRRRPRPPRRRAGFSAQLWSPAASEQQAVPPGGSDEGGRRLLLGRDQPEAGLGLQAEKWRIGRGLPSFLQGEDDRQDGGGGSPELALAPSEKMEVEESKQCVGEDVRSKGEEGVFVRRKARPTRIVVLRGRRGGAGRRICTGDS
ncbi:uncharacterized protein M6B38_292865 [Iris pallida]|uniref:Uncharacterized protein n=1 Tax=Iris pallida TaxID=29817 RepID=A0AAX6HUV4_IRIPA|nr:uncharacterized protein M6B38_292865 [Iris pallida]